MRNLFLALLLLPLLASAQRTELKDTSIKVGQLQDIECILVSETYVFLYKNYNQSRKADIQSLSVSENDFETLYVKLIEAYDLPGEEFIQLDLPDNILRINTSKLAEETGIVIYNLKKGAKVESLTQTITRKELTKLFGKR